MKPSTTLPALLLSAAFPAAQAATTDLLQPAWKNTWQITTEKVIPVKITFAADTGWMTAKRPGALFNPVVLATHFGKKGPLAVGATTPPEISLENIGDTIGLRLVVAYNQEACKGLTGNTLRLALANSRGTRQAAPLWDIKNPVFDDDTGWCLQFGQGKVTTVLFHRPTAAVAAHKNTIVTSLYGGKNVKSWPNPPPVGQLKPNEPMEAIFSLTRTGPAELKVYGFMASQEVEHVATGVTDFSFDTLYFHFPNGSAEPGAAFTIREFQLMTP